MRQRIDAVNASIGLLGERGDELDLRTLWLATLMPMIDRTDLHGLLLGRITRLLLDAEQLSDVVVRV